MHAFDFDAQIIRGGDRPVLMIRGDLDTEVLPRLTDALEELSTHDVDIDASGVTFIGSAALQVLAHAWRRATAEQRSVRIVRPSPPVARLLEVTALTDMATPPVTPGS
jgi:anti-anti-sigma factor